MDMKWETGAYGDIKSMGSTCWLLARAEGREHGDQCSIGMIGGYYRGSIPIVPTSAQLHLCHGGNLKGHCQSSLKQKSAKNPGLLFMLMPELDPTAIIKLRQPGVRAEEASGM